MLPLFALLAAGDVALFAYKLPPVLTFSSAAYGAAFGLFPISWIVFWAITLYRVTVDTGKFEIIKASMGNLTSDARLQALLIAFAFGAFVEGAAGFGTPVAVAAAMLVGLGFSPFYASALCLVANTAPVAFGSIGIPVVTLAGITGLPLDKLSGAVGRLCAPLVVVYPLLPGLHHGRVAWHAGGLAGRGGGGRSLRLGAVPHVEFRGSATHRTSWVRSPPSLALLVLLAFLAPATIWDRELEPVVTRRERRTGEKVLCPRAGIAIGSIPPGRFWRLDTLWLCW